MLTGWEGGTAGWLEDGSWDPVDPGLIVDSATYDGAILSCSPQYDLTQL